MVRALVFAVLCLSLYIKRSKMSVHNVRTFVRNAGRGLLSSPRRHNENDVIMIIAGLWRYGDWRHVATGCDALVTHMCCV